MGIKVVLRLFFQSHTPYLNHKTVPLIADIPLIPSDGIITCVVTLLFLKRSMGGCIFGSMLRFECLMVVVLIVDDLRILYTFVYFLLERQTKSTRRRGDA